MLCTFCNTYDLSTFCNNYVNHVHYFPFEFVLFCIILLVL